MQKHWLWLSALLLVGGACTEDDAVPGGSGDAGDDASLSDDLGLPPPLDARVPLDRGRALGQFGDPCTQGRDCESGYCIESPQGGRICTMKCGDCPDGFQCDPIANDGPDRTFVCLFDQPDLCKPCRRDQECDDNEDLCLPIGNRTYCGEDCSDDGYCPEGYECKDIEGDGDAGVVARQCVPANDETCDPCADDDGDGYGDGGDCLGFDCNDNDPEIYEGATEVCDGRDNNCNSVVDEPELIGAPPDDLVCESAGICRGVRPACISGRWRCDYPDSYEEGVERSCDGLDNDCDGAADDDFDLQSDPDHCSFCGNACRFQHAAGLCVAGSCELGDCEPGWHNIDGNDGNGCEYACNPTHDGVEVCDRIDNDCDGDGDEDFDTRTDPQNCGACNVVCAVDNGTPGCVNGGCAIASCEAGWVDLNRDPRDGCEFPCLQSNDGIEICDQLDNDCDGRADEDFDLNTSLEHCGACGEPCNFDRGIPACNAGRCEMVGCLDGWWDPNGIPVDGCEYNCVVSRDGVEACDAIDNDCDGEIDEDFDLANNANHCGACGRACFFPNATGACVAMTCQLALCNPGFWDVDQSDLNGCEYRCDPDNAGVEACDLRDNDCDGAVDEDFDVLTNVDHCGRCNNPCFLDNAVPRCGGGECLIQECVGGSWDLDGDPDNGCEYPCQPTNGGVETCDGFDNDCDGDADEDFDFQTNVQHCGGCGRACAFDDGQVDCVNGGCVLTGCEAGFYDLDGDARNGCEYQCEFQGDVDIPDPDYIDANCDGIDGNIRVAVFVAANGNDNDSGGINDPLRSIGEGISRASNRGVNQVIVAAGSYDETVVAVNGVGLFGGFNRELGWRRDIGNHVSRINGRPTGLLAQGINRLTRVEGFTITSANAGGVSESSYAVFARDVAANMLALSHNVIQAGNGGPGGGGGNGNDGPDGEPGGGGGIGCDGCSGGGGGGGGGASQCNRGGDGGGGGYNGASSGAGAQGGGGTPGGAAVGTGCSNAGRGGSNGGNAGGGGNGAGGDGRGSVQQDTWVGNNGRDGSPGGHGNGGGGASGGGGTTSCTSCGVPCDLLLGCVCRADRGGGGGGGGGGGCGGGGGAGGQAAGGSFGVFLVRAHVRLEANVVRAGNGGAGGRGGNGGGGGTGAGGGGGGGGRDDSGPGGAGGRGGNGGTGGYGGGGSGGVSFALYTFGSNPTVDADNQLVAGNGGAGGFSSGSRGAAGQAAPRN